MKLEKDNFIKEVIFKTSRSGGSGGQNVNKVATKVELIFNLANSTMFTDTQKVLLAEKLAGKLDSEGNLHVVSQEDRSQLANKENAIGKTILMLTKALLVQKKRKPTKVPKSVIQKRLDNKSVNALKKDGRKKPKLD